MSGMDKQDGSTSSDEEIGRWIDGALPPEGMERMERQARDDEAMGRRVARLRHLDALVRETVPAEDAVPAELLERLGLAELGTQGETRAGSVIDLASVRAARRKADREAAAAARRRAWKPSRWLSSRAAVQILLLAGVGLIAALWHTPLRQGDLPSAPPAEYRALGDAPSPEDAANAVILFAPSVDATRAKAMSAEAGARLIGEPGANGSWRAAIAPGRRDAVLARLRETPGVTLAEPIEARAQ